jgi:hypothetical protein
MKNSRRSTPTTETFERRDPTRTLIVGLFPRFRELTRIALESYCRPPNQQTEFLKTSRNLKSNPARTLRARNRSMPAIEKIPIDWQWSSARWYEGLPYDPNIRLPKLEKLPAEFLAQAAR